MFGYLRPYSEDMTIRQLRQHRAIYCGVCKQIAKRYGLFPRIYLQYDCAFLAALLSFRSGQLRYVRTTCPLRCRFRNMCAAAESDALDYAADINVILGRLSALDKWRDEHSIPAGLLALLTGRAYRKAVQRQPEFSREADAQLKLLDGIEKARSGCTDEPSDAFGKLMESVIVHAPTYSGAEAEALKWLFYNLGRWIYLADAWEDREKDRKSGAYNPFLIGGQSETDAEYLMKKSLDEAEKAYELLDMELPHSLTDNIVLEGCRARTEAILHPADRKKKDGAYLDEPI